MENKKNDKNDIFCFCFCFWSLHDVVFFFLVGESIRNTKLFYLFLFARAILRHCEGHVVAHMVNQDLEPTE
ncbi:hypothetical protein TRSC58_07388 [Trypanosoma rangeli SC58]|uniref:Uncharacterized protein n=1 Tax=Trypanosoma rangeli SC58 TaxID=429131 RepID=A0A061IRM7_TRYRA|nr:hypothetical protein TRSC58_07388 [Trypanosoma rangeli SC58]